MGGLVAYHMAQLLAASGQPPAMVVMFDTHNLASTGGSTAAATLATKLAFLSTDLRNLTPIQIVRYFAGRARYSAIRYWREGPAMLARLGQRFLARDSTSSQPLSVEEINHRATLEYAPRPYAGRVALFQACHYPAPYRPPQESWQGTLGRNLQIVEIAGSPRSLFVPPYIGIVGAKLRECLEGSLPALL